jgi:hypothetical protein
MGILMESTSPLEVKAKIMVILQRNKDFEEGYECGEAKDIDLKSIRGDNSLIY